MSTPLPTTTENVELDLRNPHHASAYLLAASHFLGFWPQNWSAERLAMALVTDSESDPESPSAKDQKEIRLPDFVSTQAAHENSDPHMHADSLICSLAEDVVGFADRIVANHPALIKALNSI